MAERLTIRSLLSQIRLAQEEYLMIDVSKTAEFMDHPIE
jgi:hypothetical protein